MTTTTPQAASLLAMLEEISRYDTQTLEQAFTTIRWELRNRPDTDYVSIVWCTATSSGAGRT